MTELKPCPFCGGVGVLENGPHDAPEEGYSIAQIRCEKCHATVYGQSFNYYQTPYLNENGEAKHEASAIEAWNRRVTDERSDNRR